MSKLTTAVSRRAMLALPAPLFLLPLLAPPQGPTPREQATRMKISGTETMTYTQQQAVPLPGAPGHVLVLGEARGTNRSTGQHVYMDGAESIVVSTADLDQGNGSDRGYIIHVQGADMTVSRIAGTIKTTLSADKTLVTTFEGT